MQIHNKLFQNFFCRFHAEKKSLERIGNEYQRQNCIKIDIHLNHKSLALEYNIIYYV